MYLPRRAPTEIGDINVVDICRLGTSVFTARHHAGAVGLCAMALCPSVCLSVCLTVCRSVISQSSNKMAKRRIMPTVPHNSPGI